MHPRTDAMLNGALVGIGTLGIADQVIVHWVWQLHRAVAGPGALKFEIALFGASMCLVLLGVWREGRSRLRH